MPHPRFAAAISAVGLAGLVAVLVWASSSYGWNPGRPWVAMLAWFVAFLIIALNMLLLFLVFRGQA